MSGCVATRRWGGWAGGELGLSRSLSFSNGVWKLFPPLGGEVENCHGVSCVAKFASDDCVIGRGKVSKVEHCDY